LHYLTVTPTSASINVGQQQSFIATAFYSDGTSQNVTASSSTIWASSNSNIATVAAGVATGVGGGTATITASVGTVKKTASLTVTGVQSIAVTPAFATIGVEGTQAFKAMATVLNPDGTVNPTPVDVTMLATWNSSNTAAATIDSTQDATNGTATAVATGLTQITASYQGITSNIAYLTVGTPPPTVVKLTVAPLTATIAAGQTIQFAATEDMSDGTTVSPPANPVTWTIPCTPANAATIGATTGLAVAQASGAGASCTVTATDSVANNPKGTAALSITAAVARFAYIANISGGTISAYAANAAGGALTFLAKYPTTAGPQQVIVHPSGNYLYVIDSASDVQLFDINPVTGTVTAAKDAHNNPLVYPAGVENATDKGVIDPSGSFLYVVNGSDYAVYGFTISQTDGSLTAVAGTKFAVGVAPSDVLIDHTGTYLYVINAGDADISGFTITPLTGVLVANNAATPPYTPTSLNAPNYGTIDPTNTYLYVPTGDNNVSSFQITSNGQLSTPGTVSTVGGTTSALTNIVIDPSDSFAYVVDNNISPSNIYAVKVGAGGALGPAIGTGPTPAGSASFGMTIDPTSALLAVDNQFSDTISLFSIGSNGALTPLVPASTGAAPLFLAFDIGTAAATVAPAEVVTANKTTRDISAFTAASGVLAADANAPYAGVAGNSQIGSSVTGSLFFTGSASGEQLAGYGFNTGNTPAIAALSGSPYSLTPAGAAGTVIADPSNLFAYVADTTNAQVDIYSYNSTTNSLAAGTPATGLTGLQSLVSDPQANFVFGLSSNGTVTPIEPQLSTGGLPLDTPLTLAGANWTIGAVDASGQYLLAVDSAVNKIHIYPIGPAGSGIDGLLPEVGSGTSIPAAALPVAMAFDPLDRFVVVTDATNKTITPFLFTYDPATPTLTAGTAVTVPSAPGQVTIDPTGKYLFVALVGASNATPPSGVAVYTVGVSGGAVTLTPVANSPFTTGTGASGTTGVGVINSVQ